MSAVATGVASADKFLFETYLKQKRLALLQVYQSPFLGMLKKDPTHKGKAINVPVQISAMGGEAVDDYATAVANTRAAEDEAFRLTTVRRVLPAQFEEELLADCSKDNEGGFMAIKARMDSLIRKFTGQQAREIIRGTGGAIAQLATSGSGGSGSLVATSDARWLTKGMVLKAGPNQDGTSIRGGTIQVVSIDQGAGTFTWQQTDQLAGLATNDYLFPESNQTKGYAGYLAWIPQTAPTSGDSFYGVDRSENVHALAGLRLDRTGDSMESAFIDAAGFAYANCPDGMFPTAGFCHPDDYRDLLKDLGDRAITFRNGDRGSGQAITSTGKKVPRDVFSYSGLALGVHWGQIPIYADPYWVKGAPSLVNMDTFSLISKRKSPYMRGEYDGDGLQFLRSLQALTYQVDLVSFANLQCVCPPANLTMKR